jgi:adenylate cyclase
VAGVIGRRKFIYDLWGDAVNTASRMESHGTAGQVQIAEGAYELLKDDFVCQPRGLVEVKGKGAIRTWYLVGPKPR